MPQNPIRWGICFKTVWIATSAKATSGNFSMIWKRRRILSMQSCAVLRNRYFGLRWTMKKAIPTKRHFQLRSLTTITKTSTAASILSGLISMPIFSRAMGHEVSRMGIDGEPFQRGGAFLRYEPQGADGRNFRNGISAFVGLPVPSGGSGKRALRTDARND